MSKIDEKYIDALNSFTESLEQIVETLKNQQESNKIDTVNEMLRSTQTEKLQNVVDHLTAVTKQGISDIKTQNETILKRIETIKQQKESGMFDNVSNVNNKKKIVDGVAVIGLIAVGVLAIGMAFKIIGKVDFPSVIALSTAMIFTSISFAKVSENIKNVKYSDIFKTASVLPIMAMGLIAAGWILRGFPTFGLMQGISLILVGGAIGLASYLLLKSIKNIDLSKNMISILALPIILPAIALGLISAAWILTGFPTIGLLQGISMIIVSATIGIASFLILKSLSKIDISKNWATIMALPLILPAVSLGLLLSGFILSGFTPLKDPMGLVVFSLAIGLSILFIAPSVYLLGKMNYNQLEKGIVGIIAVSAAIVAISYIMSALSTTLKYPGFLWSLGVGLSLIIFGVATVAVGFLASSPLTGEFFYPGLLAMLLLSGTILAIDKILSFGNYNKYPDFNWVKGAGLSLLAFGVASVVLGLIVMSGIGAVGLAAGALALVGIAAAMLAVDVILNAGSFSKYPSEKWAMGVSKSMALFTGMGTENKGILGSVGGAISGFIKGVGGAAISATMIPIAKSMLEIDKIFSQGNFTKYPSREYAESVSYLMGIISSINVKSSPSKEYSDNIRYYILSIVDIIEDFNSLDVKKLDNFNNSLNKIVPALQQLSTLQPMKNGTSGYSEILNNLKNLPEMSIIDAKAVSIGKLANSFASLANSLNLVNGNLQGFTDLSKGLFLISIIDDDKFNNVLESIDKYKNTLQVINNVPEEQTNLLSVIKGLYETIPNINKELDSKGASISPISEISDRDKKLSDDISAIRELLTQVKNSIEITSVTTGASFRDKIK